MFEKLKRKITVWRVNKALNIKLYKHQIDYIFQSGTPSTRMKDSNYRITGRRTGATTAYILRILLNDGVYHLVDIKPDKQRNNLEYRKTFRGMFLDIYNKLKKRNLVRCTIQGVRNERSTKKQ